MLFVFCLDESFLIPTGVAIRSLDRFLSASDQIAVLYLGLDMKAIEELEGCASNATVSLHSCDSKPMDPAWIPPSHVSTAAFLRYLAPEVLEAHRRCVYLDGDVLVRHDPAPLFDVDLQGRTLGAVQSRVTPFVASKGGVAAWREAQLPSMTPYFNSGVLVMDLDRWRQREITASITRYLSEHGAQANLADQEALNVAVHDDWIRLDRTWNYVTYVADYFLETPETEPTSPAIAHFAGRTKPWSYERAPLFTDEWFELLDSTPWKGLKPTVRATQGLSRSRRIARRVVRLLNSLGR